MFGRTVKVIIAICFIPVVTASTKAFFKGLHNLDFLNINTHLIIGGFFTYPIFHILFSRPMYIYALGHETVHVLATWLCGGKVLSFHVSDAGGNVTTTKTNLFIRLSPYFVPIHVIFLFFVYWILRRFLDISGISNEFIFLVGFAMSFHIFMTIDVMKTKQPDIVKTGYLFSVFLIYVANIFVLVGVLSFIFAEISFLSFVKNTLVFSKNIYLDIFSAIAK